MSGWSSDVCSSDLIVSGATVLTGQNLNPSFQDSLVLERDTMITDLKGLSAHLAGLSATDTLSIASNKATFSPLASGSSLAVFNLSSGQFNQFGEIQFNLNGFDTVIVNVRSEEHTSELQSLMRISYAVFCLKK